MEILDIMEVVIIKVAVLMSTYNGEKYIREQIDSILGQVGDMELDLFVRDDGSKDSTSSILDEYKDMNKLDWYTSKNLGPAKSFMDLLLKYEGYDFYVFADQDDVWDNNKVISAINKIKDIEGPALYYSNAKLVDSDLNDLSLKVYNRSQKTDFNTLVCAGGLLGCTMVFNRKLADEVRKKDRPEKVLMHDYYLAVVCVGLGGKIVYDDNCYMKYRQHSSNVVGVSYGILGKIKNRMKRITKKIPVSIAEQAEDILQRYKDEFLKKDCKWLETVANYRNSVWKRFRLAISLKTRYSSMNMAVAMRMAILLGNR